MTRSYFFICLKCIYTNNILEKEITRKTYKLNNYYSIKNI